MDIEKISGIKDFEFEVEKLDKNTLRKVFKIEKDGKSFLVENKHTIEVRTDEKLGRLLSGKYETVMESRYFGRGGIEIVKAGKQLKENEIEDLIRLSYNLTKEMEQK